MPLLLKSYPGIGGYEAVSKLTLPQIYNLLDKLPEVRKFGGSDEGDTLAALMAAAMSHGLSVPG